MEKTDSIKAIEQHGEKFLAIITRRRSYRDKFIDKPISQTDIEKLIEAARWAPSPFNIQPWELILITSKEKREALAELTAKSIIAQFKDPRFLSDNGEWMRLTMEEWQKRGDGVLIDDHVNLPDFIKDKRKLRSLIKNLKHLSILGHLGAGKLPAREFAGLVRQAPLLILILLNRNRRSPGENGRMWTLLGMGAMIQNLLLMAESLNIGAQFISAPLESKSHREQVKKIFSIPSAYEPISLLRLGYTKSQRRDSVRIDASKFIHYNSFVGKNFS
ncbi:MAG: nitroreductase family protein [Candidatus Poribacteria bacterium]